MAQIFDRTQWKIKCYDLYTIKVPDSADPGSNGGGAEEIFGESTVDLEFFSETDTSFN